MPWILFRFHGFRTIIDFDRKRRPSTDNKFLGLDVLGIEKRKCECLRTQKLDFENKRMNPTTHTKTYSSTNNFLRINDNKKQCL